MEDRKKTLKDLETAKNDTQKLLNSLLEKLGESLVSRMDTHSAAANKAVLPDEDNPFHLWEEKKRLQKEIADSEENIKSIETDLRHIGELEEEINRKEREKNEKSREISGVYEDLGRFILNSSGFSGFNAAYEQEFGDISGKIDFQQKRLEELNNSEGGIINGLANGVKSMVTRTLLSRNEANLEKLYRFAGEQFLTGLENPSGSRILPEESRLAEEGKFAPVVQQGCELRKSAAQLRDEIESLRNDRRETAQALDQKGNPARRISELETCITRTFDDIGRLHIRFGSLILEKEWKKFFAADLNTERILYDKIISLDESLKNTEAKIDSTRVAIALDNEKSEILKLREGIDERRKRIAETEAVIAEMEEQITAAEKRMTELTEKYGQNQ